MSNKIRFTSIVNKLRKIAIVYLLILGYDIKDKSGKNKIGLRIAEIVVIITVFATNLIVLNIKDASIYSFFLVFLVVLKTMFREIEKVMCIDNKTGNKLKSSRHWVYAFVYASFTLLFYSVFVVFFYQEKIGGIIPRKQINILIFIHYFTSFLIELTDVLASIFRAEIKRKKIT